MQTIQIDDQVFDLLQQNAVAFVDTPNSTLRRLLGIEPSSTEGSSQPDIDSLEELLAESMAGQRTKAPKASLKLLVQKGLLKQSERLFLVDYKGNKVPQQEATVSGTGLSYKSRQYAMSDLAQELLKKVGFTSSSVRGPLHWSNSKGETVATLWQRVLDRRAAK